MSRRDTLRQAVNLSFPRPRGDEPDDEHLWESATKFSPPARG